MTSTPEPHLIVICLGEEQEKAKLAREVEDLNATVFSKSFKAPSAWAEREVKYKSERRDWDAQVGKLKDRIAALEAENARYRADNKAAEFEARIQVTGHALSLTECVTVRSFSRISSCAREPLPL